MAPATRQSSRSKFLSSVELRPRRPPQHWQLVQLQQREVQEHDLLRTTQHSTTQRPTPPGAPPSNATSDPDQVHLSSDGLNLTITRLRIMAADRSQIGELVLGKLDRNGTLFAAITQALPQSAHLHSTETARQIDKVELSLSWHLGRGVMGKMEVSGDDHGSMLRSLRQTLHTSWVSQRGRYYQRHILLWCGAFYRSWLRMMGRDESAFYLGPNLRAPCVKLKRQRRETSSSALQYLSWL